MPNEVKEKKKIILVQVIPFFENLSTYKQAQMIATALKVKLNRYFLNAVADYYQTEFKSEFKYINITELYDLLMQVAKKRNRSIPSTIEQCVKDFNEKKFREMK